MERTQDKPIDATMQHLTLGGVETFFVPLSPLAEHCNIATKLHRLMSLCDALEVSLKAVLKRRRRLLESIVHRAFAPVLAMDDAV